MVNETTYIRYVNISNEIVSELGKFAIMWNIFENEKCDYDCTTTKIRDMEEALNRCNQQVFMDFASAMKNRKKYHRCNTETYVRTKLYPAHNARISTQDRATDMPIIIKFINSGGVEEKTGALLAIFRIRNNMFHGLKGHYTLNSQIELFKAINAVLEEVVT